MTQKVSVASIVDSLLEEFEQHRVDFLNGLGTSVNTFNHYIRSGAIGERAYWEWSFSIEGVQEIYSSLVVYSNERGTGYDIAVTLEPDVANAYLTRPCDLEKAPQEVFEALSRLIFLTIGYF